MNKITISFIITFISGVSTILGVIPTYFNSKYKDKIIYFSLIISSVIMIYISIFSLIPEALKYFNNKLILLVFINIGFIISSYIDKNIDKRINDNILLKVGITTIIALIIHNMFEGITTFISTSNDLKLGINLSIGIALHNIGEGISIAIPIYYSTKSRKKAYLYTFISGISEFIGAIFSYLFLSNMIDSFIIFIIISITIGIMLQISIFELIPASIQYKKRISPLSIISL